MTRRRRTAEEWRRVVFRANRIRTATGEEMRPTASTRLLLIYLADFMNDTDRKVSRPRHLIARDLGVSERRVAALVAEATTAGLLSTVVRGHKGVTAVYQGLFPTVVSVNNVVHAESAEIVHAETPFSMNPVVRTNRNHGDCPRSPHCWGCPHCTDSSEEEVTAT